MKLSNGPKSYENASLGVATEMLIAELEAVKPEVRESQTIMSLGDYESVDDLLEGLKKREPAAMEIVEARMQLENLQEKKGKEGVLKGMISYVGRKIDEVIYGAEYEG
ncbi:hypothetical protein GF354_04725 [Candidatus Peregrinibacteria bacterium]|nr:hypothetical protein [Candidatus Peregrinibacteria bacterium]